MLWVRFARRLGFVRRGALDSFRTTARVRSARRLRFVPHDVLGFVLRVELAGCVGSQSCQRTSGRNVPMVIIEMPAGPVPRFREGCSDHRYFMSAACVYIESQFRPTRGSPRPISPPRFAGTELTILPIPAFAFSLIYRLQLLRMQQNLEVPASARLWSDSELGVNWLRFGKRAKWREYRRNLPATSQFYLYSYETTSGRGIPGAQGRQRTEYQTKCDTP
jgi:hypothetical protein